jgi:hypothetical protein
MVVCMVVLPHPFEQRNPWSFDVATVRERRWDL